MHNLQILAEAHSYETFHDPRGEWFHVNKPTSARVWRRPLWCGLGCCSQTHGRKHRSRFLDLESRTTWVLSLNLKPAAALSLGKQKDSDSLPVHKTTLSETNLRVQALDYHKSAQPFHVHQRFLSTNAFCPQRTKYTKDMPIDDAHLDDESHVLISMMNHTSHAHLDDESHVLIDDDQSHVIHHHR